MEPTRRTEYDGEGLAEGELAPTPLAQIERWVAHAQARQDERGDVPEPMAMALATTDTDGPDVRTVLLRFLDRSGLGFVTHLDSAKGRQLLTEPACAAALTWPSMFRSVRVRGAAVPVERAESDAYFRQRPWGSRVSAWASQQSEPAASRAQLEADFEQYAARFPDHGAPDDVPVPPRWGAVRIQPHQVEFWAGRRNRLHDRLVLVRTGDGDLGDADAWTMSRLQP